MNVYIRTFGCSANYNNSEIMAGLLERAGCVIVSSEKLADIVIINSCIVKGPTESRVINEIKKYLKNKLVIAGCMPEVEYEVIKKIAPKAALVGVSRIKDIVKAVKALQKNKRIEAIGKGKEIKLCLPKIRRNKIINIVQISEGCVGNCSYCIVRLAKGKLFSYPKEKIVEEIKAAVNADCKEIWLTSQDTAAYGIDVKKKSVLPELLNEITKIKGNFKVRVGMMNPNHILPVLDDLVQSFKSEKIFKFLHIPVQSGNDKILKLMNRKYKINDFKKIIKKFRKEIPEITISTDIICGFPTETEEQFDDSLKLIEEIKPDVLNISRFWPRPKTEAIKLKPLPGGEINDRSRKLSSLFYRTLAVKNRKWIGWKGKILIDEKGKDDTWIGRNFAYKSVIVKGDFRIGQIIGVKVVKTSRHDLIAATNLS